MPDLDRRNFVRLCSAAAATLTSARARSEQQPQQFLAPRVGRGSVKSRKNVVAIQVRAFGWVDEGVDQVLDNIQHKGNVNTVWAYTFAYGETRLKKGVSLPDHGTPLAAGSNEVQSGAFYDYDSKYFVNTALKDFRSTSYGKFNVIEQAAPKAKARGMDFFAWDLNNAGPSLNRNISNYAEVSEVDAYGRPTGYACFNNPDYRAFLSGKVQSVLIGYASLVDGYAWGCERMGPLDNMIGGSAIATCFCRFCQARARERDISVPRAQAGYRALTELFSKTNQPRPSEGYFTAFWSLLLRYPEILAWETLWTDSFQEVQADLYGIAKSIAPEKPFGFHIMQSMTFSPFYRAEEDYTKRRNFADFLKLATYNNAGGPRMSAYLENLSRTIFRDAQPKDFLDFYYKIMGYKEATTFDQLGKNPLSTEYIVEETKRALQSVAGEVKIYPGIDIDVPVLGAGPNPADYRTKPEYVRAAIRAAFGAGADGVVLSREYVEMWLSSLTAAGDTLRELFPQLHPKS
jgi:hypothetical protein